MFTCVDCSLFTLDPYTPRVTHLDAYPFHGEIDAASKDYLLSTTTGELRPGVVRVVPRAFYVQAMHCTTIIYGLPASRTVWDLLLLRGVRRVLLTWSTLCVVLSAG